MNFKNTLSSLFQSPRFATKNIKYKEIKDEKTKSNAIIIVHGIIAGGIFYRGETHSKYHKNENIWLPIDNKYKLKMLKGIAKYRLFYKDFLCDENGEPLNQNIGVPLEDEEFPHQVDANIAKYGCKYAHKKLIDALTDKFPEYNVFLHNYDWRLNLNSAAESLLKKTKKYKEVILIGYSLGGMGLIRYPKLN